MKSAFALILVLAAVARSDGGRIRGTVADVTGAPMPNAIVDVISVHDTEIANARTDAKGQFSLPGIRAGRYDLRVQSAGFSDALIRSVNVSDGSDELLPEVRLKLLPEGIRHVPPEDTDVLDSVRVRAFWTTAGGLPSIPFSTVERAWRRQGVVFKRGTAFGGQIEAAAQIIRQVYAKYDANVRVYQELTPIRPEPHRLPGSRAIALTFLVIESCSSR